MFFENLGREMVDHGREGERERERGIEGEPGRGEPPPKRGEPGIPGELGGADPGPIELKYCDDMRKII